VGKLNKIEKTAKFLGLGVQKVRSLLGEEYLNLKSLNALKKAIASNQGAQYSFELEENYANNYGIILADRISKQNSYKKAEKIFDNYKKVYDRTRYFWPNISIILKALLEKANNHESMYEFVLTITGRSDNIIKEMTINNILWLLEHDLFSAESVEDFVKVLETIEAYEAITGFSDIGSLYEISHTVREIIGKAIKDLLNKAKTTAEAQHAALIFAKINRSYRYLALHPNNPNMKLLDSKTKLFTEELKGCQTFAEKKQLYIRFLDCSNSIEVGGTILTEMCDYAKCFTEISFVYQNAKKYCCILYLQNSKKNSLYLVKER